MREIKINLPDEVAHRFEVAAAIDDKRISEGIEEMLVYLYDLYMSKRGRQSG